MASRKPTADSKVQPKGSGTSDVTGNGGELLVPTPTPSSQQPQKEEFGNESRRFEPYIEVLHCVLARENYD